MSRSKLNQNSLSKTEEAEIARLGLLPDADIDLSDIPEALAENWLLMKRGDLYRPKKLPVTIRLDADVLAWFKEHTNERGYQTEINNVLRNHVVKSAKTVG